MPGTKCNQTGKPLFLHETVPGGTMKLKDIVSIAQKGKSERKSRENENGKEI